MNNILRCMALLTLLIIPGTGNADDVEPGASCTAGQENHFMRSGGIEIPGGHFLVCRSGAWRSVLSWDDAAAITKIGNLSCTSGQVLKFNGTIWACADDDAPGGADNLGNHTATTTLNLSGNTMAGLAVMTGSNWDDTYDVWLQGGTSTASGEARNLAILGVKTSDQLYINHASKYAGGTVIGGPVSVPGGGLTVSGGATNLGGNALTSNVGTLWDAGGGWNMEDTTWLRAYGGKAIYTTNVVRADSGVRTNQICDINGANCKAQSSLGGSGGLSCTTQYQKAASYVYNVSVTCSSGTMTGGGCFGGTNTQSVPSGNGWYCAFQAQSHAYYAYVRCCS